MDRAFLGEILEHPDDDTPRLVYADWLEEQGETERASLIRTQLELSRLSRFDARIPQLRLRERELLQRHQNQWARSFRKFTKRLEFRRGFVAKMTMAAGKFLTLADKIWSLCPLSELRLLSINQEMDQIIQQPWLGRIRNLDLHFVRLGMKRVVTLMQSAYLGGLIDLNLGSTEMRQGGLAAVCAATGLHSLRALRLAGNQIQTEGISCLVQSRGFPNLTALGLGSNSLGESSCELLGRSSRLAQLEELDLRENHLGTSHLRAFLNPGNTGQLRSLNLSYNLLDEEAMSVLGSCESLSCLESLHLDRCYQCASVRPLAESSHLHQLRELGISYMRELPDEDVTALLDAPFCTKLRILRLPPISAHGMSRLLRSRNLENLFHLEICSGERTSRRLSMDLAEATHLQNLSHLSFPYARTDEEGMIRLVNQPHVANLIHLEFNVKIRSDRVFEALIQSPYLSGACRIVSHQSKPTKSGLREALLERFTEVLIPME